MASFSNFINFLFFTTLLFSLQINARDSQFFSKVTSVNNNKKVKESEVPFNEGAVNKPEQKPVFIPETVNSYGLYGHGSGLNPPSTTTNASPYTTTNTYQQYKTESEDTTKYPTNNNYYNKDAYRTNQNEFSDTRLSGTSYRNNNDDDDDDNNNYYKNKDAYGSEQNELSETKYTGGSKSMTNQNNQKYYFNNAANDRYYNNNNKGTNDRYNGEERQGLSDTRFMEGGKYFYKVNSEKYNPTLYGGSTRGVNTENNWYKNKGYFGNNNANSYENKNSMEGYQNQEEFEDDQDNFEP